MSKKEGMMTVYNTGQQRFLIEKDPKGGQNHKYLEPGEAMEVSEELGKKLLQYKGVKDASKMAKSKSSEDYEKTIAELKEQVEKLEEKIKKLSK